MKHLSTVARIITPLAMVVFLAYEINRSMTVTGAWAIALLIGAIGTAVGIEIVGILAGHALEGFWRIGDQGRAALSFILLIAYTGTAVYILRNNSAMVLVPVIAAIVYLLASLTTSLEMTVSQHEAITAVSSAFDLEQAKADRALERELKARQLELEAKAQVQIEIAREQNQASIAIAEAKAQASIANAEARKAKALAEQSQQEIEQEQKEEAQKQYECEDCGKLFGTVQALNAHGRFCNSIVKEPSKNGKTVV